MSTGNRITHEFHARNEFWRDRCQICTGEVLDCDKNEKKANIKFWRTYTTGVFYQYWRKRWASWRRFGFQSSFKNRKQYEQNLGTGNMQVIVMFVRQRLKYISKVASLEVSLEKWQPNGNPLFRPPRYWLKDYLKIHRRYFFHRSFLGANYDRKAFNLKMRSSCWFFGGCFKYDS